MTDYPFTFNPDGKGLSRVFGELEAAVMESIWGSGGQTVRQTHESVSRRKKLAYTTIMTVMNRLTEKGLLSRRRDGSAFRYEATSTREQFLDDVVSRLISGCLEDFPEATRRALRELHSGSASPPGEPVAAVTAEPARLAQPAPISSTPIPLEARHLDGTPFAVASLEGKPSLLYFWAHWSAPASEGITQLAQLASRYENLRILPVACDWVSSRQVRKQLVELGWQGPALMADDRVLDRLGVSVIPSAMVLDNQGRMTTRLEGESLVGLEEAISGSLDEGMESP